LGWWGGGGGGGGSLKGPWGERKRKDPSSRAKDAGGPENPHWGGGVRGRGGGWEGRELGFASMIKGISDFSVKKLYN